MRRTSASGAVLVSGSGESTALSNYAGTAFIGLAYSIFPQLQPAEAEAVS